MCVVSCLLFVGCCCCCWRLRSDCSGWCCSCCCCCCSCYCCHCCYCWCCYCCCCCCRCCCCCCCCCCCSCCCCCCCCCCRCCCCCCCCCCCSKGAYLLAAFWLCEPQVHQKYHLPALTAILTRVFPWNKQIVASSKLLWASKFHHFPRPYFGGKLGPTCAQELQAGLFLPFHIFCTWRVVTPALVLCRPFVPCWRTSARSGYSIHLFRIFRHCLFLRKARSNLPAAVSICFAFVLLFSLCAFFAWGSGPSAHDMGWGPQTLQRRPFLHFGSCAFFCEGSAVRFCCGAAVPFTQFLTL